ncbi:DNA endonuclease SmrA [Microbulbifer thermotolerans]|uniref:DNA endonuclease SmrA n=1 Tax=Microbulbifer thermotolerans TaxID=252514 RepID=A0AB35I1X4_MICTH|nr:DNA endonuclease SmrA [Microbulbifer thermotolerans]MCX2781071.1 DNA endonuclease SmrA [Microbulbifer thermotolerans]MCX2783644.1 DNA endonuclease SmrA [Microbulbifer thermotolerans]MCX2796241.1 DNA endonuclease SmrA [Microbulbifer thermotolerans]MCX2803213.1 DNA endonuclease SmrA [Microbulbifer thermotolerans]MCX2806388.1 DNA endonuclease SmrA [Microbulbifer thermotolerans]
MNDSDLFQDALCQLGGVEPLAQERRVALKKDRRHADLNQRARREAAERETAQELNPLAGEFVEPVQPWDLLEFKRDGVQHGVYRNLRLGKYPVDARLDLHRHTVEMARRAVLEFVRDCVEADIRCALITHGKGEGRKQPALLKSCVNTWLPQLHEVLAFHSAQKQHGGLGATYVLLRKSERKRQENLEQHQRRNR